ncbi:precorrin-6A/cobalt-precorrin-6A reductase [Ruthenibacterium lactatiformans]|uniref:precorrin-6A/cobalt-precorrin-6A reductase n=1 Tax=Ruthenibacterium lactatiformans TaxID=1550024 RepID=UPI0039A07DBE
MKCRALQCVDATHPYAAEASGNIRAARFAAGVPYRRLLRGASARRRTVLCPTRRRRAGLAGTQGNIPLATGAKGLPPLRGWTRAAVPGVPTHEGLRPARRRACPTAISLRCRGLLRGSSTRR